MTVAGNILVGREAFLANRRLNREPDRIQMAYWGYRDNREFSSLAVSALQNILVPEIDPIVLTSVSEKIWSGTFSRRWFGAFYKFRHI